MIVKNKLKIIIPCVSLIFGFEGSSQTLDQLEKLRQLEEISELGQGNNDNDSDLLSGGSLPLDRSIQPKKKKDGDDSEDEELGFGFKGNGFLVGPESKPKNAKLKNFGYDYFSEMPTAYAPVTDIPIPLDYILGPGDEIKLILFGNVNKKYTLNVNRDGEIFLPELGPLSVAGLTFSDLKKTTQQIVDNQLIGTQVNLTLGTLRSINIFILGSAMQPGMYTVSSLSTLTNAIFLSGGIKNNGSLRNIQLKRSGNVITNYDFYDLLLNGDTSKDLRLMSGDVIFIPPAIKKVGIRGAVERPAIYELVNDETAEDLIKYAGTLKANASLNSIEIERIINQIVF